MAAESYLILHKVRGEPAFDIAHQMDMGEGEVWWIVTTSGHRAYPWWNIRLKNWDVFEMWEKSQLPMPNDWPDHYTVRKEKVQAIGSLLAKLGLAKPKAVALRRPIRG